MNDAARWAPIVFARTYAADFRFLVLPADFRPEERQWAEKMIQGAMECRRMNLHRQLVKQPRWMAAIDDQQLSDRLCLVGLVALHQELSGDDITMAHDENGRPLFGFVGYVTRGNPLPSLLPMKMTVFQPLFKQHIQRRWNDRVMGKPTDSNYEEPLRCVPNCVIQGFSKRDESVVRVHPLKDAQTLWERFASEIAPYSLCVGFAHLQDALFGPFSCTCVAEASKESEILRKGIGSDRSVKVTDKNAKPEPEGIDRKDTGPLSIPSDNAPSVDAGSRKAPHQPTSHEEEMSFLQALIRIWQGLLDAIIGIVTSLWAEADSLRQQASSHSREQIPSTDAGPRHLLKGTQPLPAPPPQTPREQSPFFYDTAEKKADAGKPPSKESPPNTGTESTS